LFVETRRHVASLDKLKLNEVEAIAQAAWRAARGLRAELDAESVFSFIAGRAVAHFHQHVFARHKGTPDHIGWMDGHLWPGAPRTTPSGIAELCERLKHHFT
jgi:diadenosine tetraphosphate (Ap4A) HIT family hydrolase